MDQEKLVRLLEVARQKTGADGVPFHVHEAVQDVQCDGLEQGRGDDEPDGRKPQKEDELSRVGQAELAIDRQEHRGLLDDGGPAEYRKKRHDGQHADGFGHCHQDDEHEHPYGFTPLGWRKDAPDLSYGV